VKSLSMLSLALFVAGMPLTTLAQQQTPDGKTDDVIERLNVYGKSDKGYLSNAAEGATKLGLSIKETPQTVTVVTREQMDDFGLDDINAVLENSATISVDQVESDRVYYNARGFKLNNFQIDGLGLPLINDNTHGRVDTAIYERVEVIHGANGIMTGVGSPSATVNMVRKRPTSETQGYVSATAGSWNKKRLEGDISGAINDSIRGRIVVAGEQSDSYLDRYENDTQLFYGVADFAVTDNTLVTLGHSEHSSDTDGNLWGALTLYYGDGSPTNFDTSTNIAADWSTWEVKEQRSFIDIEHAINDTWMLRAAYNRVRTDEDSLLFYTYLIDPAIGLDPETGLGLLGYGSEYDLDDKQDLFDIYASGSFSAWGQLHELVVGANYSRLDYIDASLYDFHTGNGFPVMPALENWDGNTPFPEFTDGLDGSDIRNSQKAIYAQTRLAVSNDFKVLVGGRYNDWNTQGIGYGLDASRDDAKFIPYLGATYALSADTTIYASYTETFAAQTQRDRNFERIAPLTGENKEVGIKSELFNRQAMLSFAYFDVQQSNLAVSDGEAENPNNGVLEPVYRTVDGISSKGFEAELVGRMAPGLQGSLAVTLFDIDGDSLVEDYTAEQLLRASLTYTPSFIDRLKVGASVQWQDETSRIQGVVSDEYDNAGDTIVTTQGAYARINLMASYAFSDYMSLNLNANNVGDKKYLNSLLWAQGYYGAPANYSATLIWSF